MSEHLDRFAPMSVAAITFAPVDRLAAHREHLNLPFPLLADPDRSLYQYFGLRRGSLRNVWSGPTLRLYAELLKKGRRLRTPTEDTRQLGGDFVLDSTGRLVHAVRPASPDARPTISELIDAVNAAASVDET